MNIFKTLICVLILLNIDMAFADNNICNSVYGKHRLYHHIKEWNGSKKFSEPMLLELEIKRDGSVISSYYFDNKTVETTIFSQEFPQLTFLGQGGNWQIGCIYHEPECERLREDVRGYFLNSLIYLDIENESEMTARPQVALMRKKILACVNHLREKIIHSTIR